MAVAAGSVLGGSANAARAQDSPVVAEVRFQGLARTTEAYVRSVVETRSGDPFDQPTADADVTRLLTTRRFASAIVETEPTAAGMIVTFVVQERPTVERINFIGAAKFKDKKLLEQVPLQPGDPVDPFAAREGADAILQLYRDEGFGQAVVTYDAEALNTTGELVYTIEEGPRVRVRGIVFEGNTGIADKELRKQITTNTYVWIFRDGRFDEDTIEADAASVQNYYRDQGYLDCRVSYRLEFAPNQEDLTVTFTVVEGTRYLVESIAYSGAEVFAESDLAARTTLEVGGPILQDRLDRDVKSIQTLYGENGYIYVRVRALRVFSETPGFVLVTIEIIEGNQYYVGRIVPRGNERTQDKVVRRELDLFPGDVYNTTKATEAEESLRLTQIFSTATVTPVGDQPDVRDVLINVEESRKAGDFIFGFGVTSNSGLVGSIILDIKNFDLFDTPRSFEEFVKLRSFHGAGQRLRIEAQPGTELNRFRIDFTEPYFLDQKLRFDLSAYYFDRRRIEFDERRIGGNVSFGKRLPRGWLKDWYAELALRLEQVNISGVDIFSARDIRDDEGNSVLTSAKVSVVRDRTDSRFLPTRGDRLRVSYEQVGVLGGEHFFGKLVGNYTWHTTLYTDAQERKHVLSLDGTAGAILGDAPVFERFYAGGIGSIRGFQFRGVSPRQGFDDDAIGGDLLLLFSTEYSFPLYGELLRGLVFSDMGTVERDFELSNWRVALGAGIRLHLDFFGPVPLEFDVAAPVIRNGDDEEQVFSFFIGASF